MKEELGILGYQDDIIGFGLAGVKNIAELSSNPSDEEITKALEHLKGSTILFVNESLLKKVRSHKLAKEKFFVSIPGKTDGDANKKIDNLVLETLGITIKNNDK